MDMNVKVQSIFTLKYGQATICITYSYDENVQQIPKTREVANDAVANEFQKELQAKYYREEVIGVL